MAVKVIIKPGGIALISLGVLALSAQAVLQSRSRSNTAAAASSTVAAAPKSASPAPSLAEDQFWSSSKTPGEVPLVVEQDTSAPSGTGRVAHLKITAAHGESWDLQTGVGIPVAQKVGDKKTLHFWGKTSGSESRLTVAVEFNTEPFEKFVSEDISLTSEWKEYTVPVTFTKEVPLGKGNITFQAGKATADVLISGVRFD
ncbi:hypothetical protein [Armatimonas rosea]|uniref:CBM-cenC domain-containing protein n=1 Tax=Armatimonas rosea TaxID=685828 RepID=A0A7W9SRZ1_ARMRO|nr:hypothetical protein [Armatimonas rosea]MBB6051727.1 hypothetical protein [Armatimonas rosea]